jgi:outer membrane protein assembly factor BamA
MTTRAICLSLLMGAAAAAPLHAQEQKTAPATVDVGDLWRDLRHRDAPQTEAPATNDRRRFLVVAPTIGSKPTTGLTGGLNGNMAFFRGDPQTTHISTLQGGFRVSQKQQVLSGFRLSMFTADDRWYLQGDHRLQWSSQNTYGLGADTLKAGSENVKFTGVKIYETAYRHVARGLFVGAGLNLSSHSDVRPGDGSLPPWDQSAYVAYNQQHGFSADGQSSGGTTVGLLYDTRDNGINPQHGWLASSVYRTFYKGFLGGDASWQELYLDVRTYRKITSDGRHRLAFWGMSDLVTGGTAPYLDLPTTGGDGRSARGYGEGRYRGNHLAYGEVEYRGTLTSNGLLGFVAFVNTTTIDNAAAGQKLFETWAPAVGTGLRVLLNKRSRTNLATDYAWGKAGARGFYLGIQEAF